MLPLEKQVCSLEIAKRLKELNCPQESLFWWRYRQGNLDDKSLDFPPVLEYDPPEYSPSSIWTQCSAFTVAELGELLPFSVMIRGRVTGWDCYKREDGQGWEIWLQENTRLVGNKIEATTEADARALLLIHLIKNNLCTT